MWNTLSKGWINISRRGSQGHQACVGSGHYCAPNLEYARFYSRPQIVFDDNCYHRVMYRLACDENKVKSKRWISEGMEYITEEGNIILLAVMIKPNCPPVEFTEERFNDWNPALEIHPDGLEEHHPTFIKNEKCKDWPEWHDYEPYEKKKLREQAEINRKSEFQVGFAPLVPLAPKVRTWAPVQGFIPPHLANMKITIQQGRQIEGFYCPFCKFLGHLDARNLHIKTDQHKEKPNMGVWAAPVEPTPRSRSRSPSRAAAGSASGPDPMMTASVTPPHNRPPAGD